MLPRKPQIQQFHHNSLASHPSSFCHRNKVLFLYIINIIVIIYLAQNDYKTTTFCATVRIKKRGTFFSFICFQISKLSKRIVLVPQRLMLSLFACLSRLTRGYVRRKLLQNIFFYQRHCFFTKDRMSTQYIFSYRQ